MKRPTVYSLFVACALAGLTNIASAKPIGFSEISLMLRMHESEASIKSEVAQRKLLHPLTQPQEGLLKSQGASDSLVSSLRDSKLVASKEEVAAAEASRPAPSTSEDFGMREHGRHPHLHVFDVAFGHPVNLSQWGGLDYEFAFYSYRFAGEDHIEAAQIDQWSTKTVVARNKHFESEGEVFGEDWFPTNGVRNWRYTPYNGDGGTLYNGRGDFRDSRFNWSDTVALSGYAVSRPITIDWDDPVFLDGYTCYPVYGAGGIALYFINSNSYSAKVAVSTRGW
jgi:hypothetical protein